MRRSADGPGVSDGCGRVCDLRKGVRHPTAVTPTCAYQELSYNAGMTPRVIRNGGLATDCDVRDTREGPRTRRGRRRGAFRARDGSVAGATRGYGLGSCDEMSKEMLYSRLCTCSPTLGLSVPMAAITQQQHYTRTYSPDGFCRLAFYVRTIFDTLFIMTYKRNVLVLARNGRKT